MMKHSLFLGLLCSLFLGVPQVSAATMSSDTYTIDEKRIDIAPHTIPLKAPPIPSAKTQSTAPNNASFAFEVSDTLIDFGELVATTPVIRKTTLTITSPQNDYAVFISEDNPLFADKGARIPDTTCGNGSCSEITAGPWTSKLTYGFGFRCDNLVGNDCSSDFTQDDYYKQFADSSRTEIPQALLTGTEGKTTQAQVTYKINISRTQPKGAYSNIVTYIASPNF